MAGAGPGRAAGARRGRGRNPRRPPTWEVSDSDAEDAAAAAEAGARARDAARARRAVAEARRPERVLKCLAVCVDPAVLEDAGADILMEALGTLGCEQELLLLLEPEEFLQGAAQLTQASDPHSSVPWISPENPARLHLAVIGLDAYLWSCQPSAQDIQQMENPEAARAKEVLSWPEVEEAVVLLQLCADLDVLLAASWQELSQHVCAFTKALAQRPSKWQRDPWALPFCTAGRWAAGSLVTRDGSGLRGVWWRQIRQFNRVSPAVADAVVAAFPSPRLLQQALLACSTEQERLGLLADLPVKASEGRQPHRVGPDLSRRICLFLTTTNPDLLLDLGC